MLRAAREAESVATTRHSLRSCASSSRASGSVRKKKASSTTVCAHETSRCAARQLSAAGAE